MNILIPDQWLREHLQSKASKKDLQKYLSLSGPSVERIHNDEVYDIEITTNRVDSMSVRGIAREAATILKRAGIAAKLRPLVLPEIKQHPGRNLPLPEIIYETDSVRRVLGVVLTDLVIKPSPKHIQERLRAIEVNVHDALIDISNYVTHELGHPCHVFDYDKIMQFGGKIIIKEATKGKKFVTLDEIEHTTLGGEVVFESANGEIIDLPAIKGTLNTGVDKNTKSVLFWIESLDAKKVRQASMAHAIRTIAAELNEKNVDPNLAIDVLKYGVSLLEKLCGAKVASKLYDYFPGKVRTAKVLVPKTTISNYLGLELSDQEIAEILTDLDCQVQVEAQKIIVQAPTFRPDIQIPADVIEELARIYGYHNLPSQLMTGALALQTDPNTNYHFENLVKHFLANLGWQEIYSYSLVSKDQAYETGYEPKEHLKLSNPLKDENTYLRRSLVPSLVEIVTNNPTVKIMSVFELACVYHPRNEDLPDQPLMLTLLSNRPYRQVKGDFESLLARLFVFANDGELLVEEKISKDITSPLAAQEAELIIKYGKNKTAVGSLFLLKNNSTAIELNWQALLKISKRYPRYQKLAKTASIIEELTFTLPENIAVGELITSFKQVDQKIKQVELLDIYQNNYSFRFIFQDQAVNISTEVVEPIRQKIVKVGQDEFKAKLVGQI